MMAAPFARPSTLDATSPAEERSGRRDDVRLLVTSDPGEVVRPFREVAEMLSRGDLLVVNESRTIPASLPAEASFGAFRLNLSTHYGDGLWVAEPRWNPATPGPLPLVPGDRFEAAGLRARVFARFPGLSRLLFIHLEGDVTSAMEAYGEPIRYRYVTKPYGIRAYQTVFGRVPGSAEMPSAGRPFSREVVEGLEVRGVRIVPIVLHTGVSSLELQDVEPGMLPVYPEPFEVTETTAQAVNETRSRGGRVVAVGTTVVRALESASGPQGVRPARGFTRAYLRPARPVTQVDGLITGLHEHGTTHFALLESIIDRPRLLRAYARAVEERLLWHEFGDSHLIWRPGRSPAVGA